MFIYLQVKLPKYCAGYTHKHSHDEQYQIHVLCAILTQ